MKLKSLLIGAISLATLSLSSAALADPASDYTDSIFRNLKLMCRKLGDEIATLECLNVTIEAKTDVLRAKLESEKDSSCRMERESIEQGYSNLPLTSECQQRLVAWDKKNPELRQSELEYLRFIQRY